MSYPLPRALRLMPALLLMFGLLAACEPGEPEAPSGHDGDTQDELVYATNDTIVVTGTLIDVTCHSEMEETNGDPQACEGDYVVNGYPVGLRQDDASTVWMLVTVPQALVDYLTHTSRVTGVVRSRGVLVPQQIEVRDGDAWAAIL